MIFIDTNYFLRILQNDHKEHSMVASKFFLDCADQGKKCCSSVVVFFELYWLLNKHFYKVKQVLKTNLVNVLDMDFIDWENKEVLKQAVYSMEKFNFDLEDAYNFYFAKSKKVAEFATFDKKLEKQFLDGRL